MKQTNRRSRRRVGFAIVATLFAAFMPEALCGNQPNVLLDPKVLWGCALVYGLHALVLGRVALSVPTLRGFYLSALVFGLYEAYITRQLWQPDWDDVKIWGVGVFSVVLLVVVWHALMAFMLPMLILEGLCCRRRVFYGLLPERSQRVLNSPGFWFVLSGYGGLLNGLTQVNWNVAVGAMATRIAILASAVLLWRRFGAREADSMDDLLPSGKGLVVTVVLLALTYALFITADQPKPIPGIGPQAVIWAMYGGLAWLLWHEHRLRSRTPVPVREEPPMKVPWWALALAVLASAVGAAYKPNPLRDPAFILLFLGVIPTAAVWLGRLAWSYLPKRSPVLTP